MLVILLLAGYVTAYSVMAHPVALPGYPPFVYYAVPVGGLVHIDFDRTESGWDWFFAPIHWLDRRVRPHKWPMKVPPFVPPP